MALALAALVAVVAAAPPLGQRMDAAASHGFSGEVAVARHGKLAFARGYGLADRRRRRKVTLDTTFNRSTTRTTTASARR